MTAEGLVDYRWANSDDYGFVVDSWVKSHAKSASGAELFKCWREEGVVYVNKIIRYENVKIKIACLPEPEQRMIMGWACYKQQPKTIVYYVYVRDGFRKNGIGTKLLDELDLQDTVIFTHKPVERLMLPNSWIFNPFENHRS